MDSVIRPQRRAARGFNALGGTIVGQRQNKRITTMKRNPRRKYKQSQEEDKKVLKRKWETQAGMATQVSQRDFDARVRREMQDGANIQNTPRQQE